MSARTPMLFAVIPTHNRPAELAALLDSIPPSVHVLVVDNASTPPVATPSGAGFNPELPGFTRFLGRRIQVYTDAEQPPNLSRLWNVGLDWATRLFIDTHADHECTTDTCAGLRDDYAVAVLNDDVVLPPGFLELLAAEMVEHDVDIAFPTSERPTFGRKCHVNRQKTRPPGLVLRMTGWCFMVRGSSGLRADERLRWWCGDDDLERSAAVHGRGTVRVPLSAEMREGLVHRHPDQSTAASPALQAQTALDMATYVKKWGDRPW